MADQEDLGSIGNATFGVVADFTPLQQSADAAAEALARQWEQLGQDIGSSLGQGIGQSGNEAAKGLQPLADSTKNVHEQGIKFVSVSQAMHEQLQGLATAFSIGTLINKVAEALTEFTKEAFSAGSEMVDMSQKTGMSMGMLQQLQYIGVQTGSSIESLTNAAFMLGTRLAAGDTSVVASVERLHLSYEELMQMSPDEQFHAVVAALQALGSEQERNAIGTELFGRVYRNIAASIGEDWNALTDGMVSNTDTQLRALDRADDAWQTLYTNLKRSVTGYMGNLSIAMETETESVKKHSSAADEHARSLEKEAAWFSVLAPLMASMGMNMGALQAQTAGATAGAESYSKSIHTLTDDQKQYIEQQVAAGVASEDIVRLVGASASATIAYAESLKNKLTPAQIAEKVAVLALKQSHDELDPAIRKAAQSMLDAGYSASEVFEKLKAGGAVTEAAKIQIDALGDAHDEAARKAKKASEDQAQAAKKLKDAQDAVNTSIDSLSESTREAILSGKAHEATEEQLALALNVTRAQVSMVIAAEKERADASAEQAKERLKQHSDEVKASEEMSEKLFKVLDDITEQEKKWTEDGQKRTLSDYDFKAAQIEAWKAKQVKALEALGISHEAALTQVESAVHLAYENIAAESSLQTMKMAADTANVKNAWADILQDIPSMLQRAFEGGGGLQGAVKSLFSKIGQQAGSGITDSIVAAGGIDKLSTGIGKLFGTSAIKAGGVISGVMSFGLGTLISNGLSALINLFAGKPVWQQFQDGIRDQWGANISEGLAKAIEDTAKSGVVHSTEAAKRLHMKEIIDTITGGVSKTNFNVLYEQLHGLFVDVSVGAMSAAQASQVLTDNFSSFVKAGTDAFGILNPKLREIIRLDQEMRTNSAGIADYVVQQSHDAIQHFTDFAKGAEIKTEEGAWATAEVIALAYGKVLASTGSVKDATAEITPVVQALEQQFKKTGLNGGDYFTEIQRRVDLMNNEAVAPAIDGVLALGQAIVSSYNGGILSALGFNRLQRELNVEAASLSQTITEQGGVANEMYAFIREPLQRILQIHRDTGWEIDAETQALIDQANAQGILANGAATVQEVLTDGFQDLIDAIHDLPDAFADVIEQASRLGKVVDGLSESSMGIGDGLIDAATGMAMASVDPFSGQIQQGGVSVGAGNVMGVANVFLDGTQIATAVLQQQQGVLAQQGLA